MFLISVIVLQVLHISATIHNIHIDDIKFSLYTPESKQTRQNLIIGINKDVKINKNYEIKILCHGYEDDGSSFWIEPMKNEYLRKGNINVIVIDWGIHSSEWYVDIITEMANISKIISILLYDLSITYDITLDKFHLIGHSLGAHILAITGQYIHKFGNKKLGRITGLDPAGPIFTNLDKQFRLDKDDAIFVDIIHTEVHLFGFPTPLGHIDFYPNGGHIQNGCKISKTGDLGVQCSHCRAPEYFYESINSNASFKSWECGSYEEFKNSSCFKNNINFMGEHVDQSKMGVYYLVTNSEAPFAIETLL